MTTRAQTLVIRADASPSIGTGHVMRCLALAQAWQDGGGQVLFMMAGQGNALEPRLTTEGFQVEYLAEEPGSTEDAARTAERTCAEGADWVVVDGYHFGSAYQRVLKEAGLRVLALDDYGHAEHYHADLVLNQNLHATASLYERRDPGTELLLGTRYVLLRREFRAWRGWKREVPAVARKVLVAMGGSDPNDVTGRVVAALPLLSMDGLEVVVVVGANYLRYDALQACACGIRGVRVLRDVSNMPVLMAWADVAVTAAGSILWELAFLGLPTLTLVLASNQEMAAHELDRLQIFSCLGNGSEVSNNLLGQKLIHLLGDSKTRRAISIRANQLVDGEGVSRAVARLD